MRAFNVLVVDDDDGVRRVADDISSRHNGVKVHTAADVSSAIAVINETFIDLAFVDLELTLHYKGQLGGKAILEYLKDNRPSCERVLLTEHVDDFPKEVARMVFPGARLIDGIAYKPDWGVDVEEIVVKRYEVWAAKQMAIVVARPSADSAAASAKGAMRDDDISIVGGDTKKASEVKQDGTIVSGAEWLVPAVFSRFWMAPKVAVTPDELEDVLGRLFIPRELTAPTDDDVRLVELKRFADGQSSAVVMEALTKTGTGKDGIRCVVKLGPIGDIREEFLRYNRFYRFQVALNRRVELLEYIPGDCVGAICYSFAGSAPRENVQSLATLFNDDAGKAEKCIEGLFDPDLKEWFDAKGEGVTLANFFRIAYHWMEMDKIRDDVVEFARRIAPKVGGKIDRNGRDLLLNGGKVVLPNDIISHSAFRKMRPSCIIHGDLHGGNVFVGESGQTIMIDYRNTGEGPRCLDFAAMDASVRIARIDDESYDAAGILRIMKREKSVWKRVWNGMGGGGSTDGDEGGWVSMSGKIGGLLLRNFDEAPQVTADEYAATCLLWGFRVFRNKKFGMNEQLRVLCWMSHLCSVLK